MAKKEKEIKNSKALAKKADKDAKSSKGKKDVKAEKKSKGKGEKELSPLEKARIAKASGKGGKAKAKSKRKPLPIFKAPEDFKPHFMTVMVKVEKDGLLGTGIRCTRFQGRYDPEADEKKKFDVGSYDPKTVIGVQARFAAVTFVNNAEKRVPPGVYQILLRVNRKSADGSLSVLFKGMGIYEKNKKGRMVLNDMDKTDPWFRKFRKAARLLPAAFKEVLMPPKRTRGANKKSEGDDE